MHQTQFVFRPVWRNIVPAAHLVIEIIGTENFLFVRNDIFAKVSVFEFGTSLGCKTFPWEDEY